MRGEKKNRLFPCTLMRTECEPNTSGRMIINQTAKGIILNKIQKIMLKFLPSKHAEKLRGR